MGQLKDAYLRQILKGELVPPTSKLVDGDGLYLLAKPLKRGGVSMYWRYDFQFNKKRATLPLGVYPDTTLSDARRLHREAKARKNSGVNPVAERRERKRGSNSTTFKDVAEDWYSNSVSRWSKQYAESIRQRLDDDIYPKIGGMPADMLKPADVIGVIRPIDKEGYGVKARDIHMHIKQICRYAITLQAIPTNPADIDLGLILNPRSVKHYAAVIEPARLSELLEAIDNYGGYAYSRLAFRLMPLVALRPNEICHARWDEVDMDGRMWVISSDRMKGRKHKKESGELEHYIPLSEQAIAILEEARELSGHCEHVFPNVKDHSRPMAAGSLNYALKSIGFRGEQTQHGFRGMFSTIMHEMGWDTMLIEAQLAHKDKNVVRRSYNHAKWLDKRREMMQAWADYLDGIRAGAGQVVPIRTESKQTSQ